VSQTWTGGIFGLPGPWYAPDWGRIAERFSGVHVSVAGLLASAYRPVGILDGRTVLAGWNPDETFWFTPPR
jgi:hypothetical protein